MTLSLKIMLSLLGASMLAASAVSDELISMYVERDSGADAGELIPYTPHTAVRVNDRLQLISRSVNDIGIRITETGITKLGNKVIRGVTDSGGYSFLITATNGEILGAVNELNQNFRVTADYRGVYIASANSVGMPPRLIDNGPKALLRSRSAAARVNIDPGFQNDVPPQKQTADEIAYPVYKAGPAVIDVLIYYDQSLGSYASVVDYLIEYANQAFSRSGVDVTLRVAGTIPIDLDADLTEPLAGKMFAAEHPFGSIEDDRSFFDADIAVTIKNGRQAEDKCGYAPWLGVWNGFPFRQGYVAVASWQPDVGYPYCPDSTLAHEIGHLLGGQHFKSEYLNPPTAAYSYSYGHRVDGVFSTLMTSYFTGSDTIQRFSSPKDSCFGYSCGAIGEADMVTTLNMTGRIVAGFEGDDFSHELVNVFHAEYSGNYICTFEGQEGLWDAHGFDNQSKYEILQASTHFVRADGSSYVYYYEEGMEGALLQPGYYNLNGYCPVEAYADMSQSMLRTEFVETFTRYYHPITRQLVQSESLRWEEGYTGGYSSARVVVSDGGSVAGNTIRSVRRGESESFSFVAEEGFVVGSVESNCSGTLAGNIYTVAVGQDDCLIQAVFKEATVSEVFRLAIENPAGGLSYSGIGTFQGWALAEGGVQRVDLYIDDVFFQSAPYGGLRGDVANIFPDIVNSKNSGFALAYNFGDLSDGIHTLKAIAVTENGRTLERSVQFSVAKFHKPFIGAGDIVSLDGASCSVQDSYISVIDAVVDDEPYNIFLEWRTGTQGFEIYRIR